MKRLTKRFERVVCYIGKNKQYDEDTAAEMSVPAIRDVLGKLAEYEDTRLEPEEIMADVRPVRRGKWIDVGECNLETIWQCSECGFKQVGQAWIGCPKCLADMREETNNETSDR